LVSKNPHNGGFFCARRASVHWTRIPDRGEFPDNGVFI
jgi:hypothetical protein